MSLTEQLKKRPLTKDEQTRSDVIEKIAPLVVIQSYFKRSNETVLNTNIRFLITSWYSRHKSLCTQTRFKTYIFHKIKFTLSFVFQSLVTSRGKSLLSVDSACKGRSFPLQAGLLLAATSHQGAARWKTFSSSCAG